MTNRTFLLVVALMVFQYLSGFAAETQNEEPKKPTKNLPIQGEVFEVQGHTSFLILPGQVTRETPWVWYAPTLPGLPGKEEKWMFEQFTNAGIAVAGIDVGESYGSPKGRALFTAFYQELVQKRGLSKKPCLLARSRGGLMLYNWAVEHPQSVAGIAGIYPVCDLRSYPGIKKACGAYDMTEEQLTDQLAANNPVDRMEPLAKARVPIFHIHGDSDVLVPLEKNSAALEEQYRKFGGPMKLTVIKGQGHNMWAGWFHCQELVDFVIARATTSDAELHSLVGRTVTLHGQYGLYGKEAPYILRDGATIYLVPHGSFGWGSEYGRMEGKMVTVTGVLRFRHFVHLSATNALIQIPPDYFYFDAETAKVKLE